MFSQNAPPLTENVPRASKAPQEYVLVHQQQLLPTKSTHVRTHNAPCSRFRLLIGFGAPRDVPVVTQIPLFIRGTPEYREHPPSPHPSLSVNARYFTRERPVCAQNASCPSLLVSRIPRVRPDQARGECKFRVRSDVRGYI